jgi:hypothetical protein
MAGLVPAIHIFDIRSKKDVDARHKAGHDGAHSHRLADHQVQSFDRRRNVSSWHQAFGLDGS